MFNVSIICGKSWYIGVRDQSFSHCYCCTCLLLFVSFFARTFAWHDDGRFSDGTEIQSTAKGIQMTAEMLVTQQAEIP
jgi:hypothetical protein